MVNEISAKRKELESKAIKPISSEYSKIRFKSQLEGFNLGVEMARKEFLGKVHDIFNEYCLHCLADYGIDDTQPMQELYLKIKQSLEEKK